MKRVIVALLVSVVLVGCTDISTAGPVVEVPQGTEPRNVQLIAEPPQPGITAVRLVENFVQAMADPELDYDVARQYLTKDAAKAWDPRTGGSVYRGVVSDDSGAVLARGVQTGELDGDGRFTATGTDVEHDFGVTEEEGEWRIGIPPSGVLVSDYIFERYWSHVTIYFGSEDGTHVVPDVIHVPDALLTPGRIVKAIVAGPSPGIDSSVINAVGSAVRLAAQSAGVDSAGTVDVALTGLDKDMSADRRRLLGAQLLWSLTAIPRVTGLRISNDGVPYPLPDQNDRSVLELESQQQFQPLSRPAASDLFGVSGGVGVRIDGDDKVLKMASGDAPVAEVAVSIDQTLVAFLDDQRTGILWGTLGGTLLPVSLKGRNNLRSAQFALGNLWFLGDDAAGVTHLNRVDAQGDIVKIDISDLDGDLIDFAVTQTGVRVVAVVERAGTRRLVMSTVKEGDSPQLVSQGDQPLLSGRSRLTNFASLDWSGGTEFVVVANSSSGRSVHRSRLDGSLVEDLGSMTEKPVQVSALPGLAGTTVVTRAEDGAIVRHDANERWTRLDEVLEDVTYPG